VALKCSECDFTRQSLTTAVVAGAGPHLGRARRLDREELSSGRHLMNDEVFHGGVRSRELIDRMSVPIEHQDDTGGQSDRRVEADVSQRFGRDIPDLVEAIERDEPRDPRRDEDRGRPAREEENVRCRAAHDAGVSDARAEGTQTA